MGVTTGTRFGPYEVLGQIGAGGMGEVYRARDPRLQRDVAIKVLPASFTSDLSRLRRFEQEARSVATLNHPNILNIHDFGTHEGAPYIITELLDGETLRSRLQLGPIPIRKAIDYALQIARGLAAAHDKNIVHRDLKPENIFLTRNGTVKILDFGLAKLTEAPQGFDVTRSLDSDVGRIVGTVGYMSPEQVRGKAVDARSDLFAFGVILYEMLTGRRAFHGDSTADTLTAILTKDPPELTQVDAQIPPALDRIVRHCLEKSPDERFQSAHDVAFDLESLTSVSSTITTPVTTSTVRRRLLGPRVVLPLAAVILFIAGLLVGRVLVATPAVPSYKQLTFRRGTIKSASIAPGGQVVYAAAWEGNPSEIYVANINTPGSTSTGLKADDIDAVSSSGEMLIISGRRFVGAFVRPGLLSRASLGGTAPRSIISNVEGADWSPDGSQIAISHLVNGRFRLEYPIGKVLYETDGWITSPRISRDGKFVAFLDHPFFGDDAGHVAIIDAGGNNKQNLSRDYASIQTLAWAGSRELWYSAATTGSSSNIYAVDLRGAIRAITQAPGGLKLLDFGRDGRAIVAQGRARVSTVVLGKGQSKERDLSIADWTLGMDLVPDGSTVLLEEEAEGIETGTYSVYIRKTDGSPPVRLGPGAAVAISPDGQWALSEKLGAPLQFQLLPTGVGEPRIVPTPGVNIIMANDGCWLPDSRHFVFSGVDSNQQPHIYVQDIEGGVPKPISPMGISGHPRCSPNGKKVAVSDPTRIDIISLDGSPPRPVPGIEPAEFCIGWSSDGQAIFVATPTLVPGRVFRVDTTTGKRQLVKEFVPADVAGVDSVGPILISPNLQYYSYGYSRQLTDLFVATGLE